ncbi:lipoprotein [Escherichia coli]|nr:lipoprotein [Escherichia coli]
MHTNDGRTIVSDGKPQTDNDTGMISYKDAKGHKQQTNHPTLKEIVDREHVIVTGREKKNPQLERVQLQHYGNQETLKKRVTK